MFVSDPDPICFNFNCFTVSNASNCLVITKNRGGQSRNKKFRIRLQPKKNGSAMLILSNHWSIIKLYKNHTVEYFI